MTETDTATPGYSCFYDFAVLTARYKFSILDQDGQPSYSQSSGEVVTLTVTN
jgi:hypothetical protein